MNPVKAMILGVAGLSVTPEERAFYAEHQPWGFILFGRNVSADGEQIRTLVSDLRDSVGRDCPVLIDQEGGRVQRIREPLCPRYPSAAALGALYQTDRATGLRAAWLMGRIHAFDLTRFGITIDCLPVLDVPVEGASNVIGDRAYGFDLVTVAEMGHAVGEGLKAGGMLPVMKHIPGHGRGMADSHHELPVVDVPLDELKAHDFEPFRLHRNELLGMSAHIVFKAIDPDHPATISKKVIGDIIRGHIGFDGLLLSDDLSMNALPGTIGERARAVAASGIDIILHCNGVMDEMKAVVAEARILNGKAKARADKVLAGFQPEDGSDEAAVRAEFGSLFAVA